MSADEINPVTRLFYIVTVRHRDGTSRVEAT
jgi:hypothetical protein